MASGSLSRSISIMSKKENGAYIAGMNFYINMVNIPQYLNVFCLGVNYSSLVQMDAVAASI